VPELILPEHPTRADAEAAAPDRLQELANSLTPRDLVTCGQKWLPHLTPFFTAREREHAGCQHRLFFPQVEFCDNLIFRSALDMLGERLLDADRTIGQSDKITVIFGRKITKHYRGKLQTEIEMLWVRGGEAWHYRRCCDQPVELSPCVT
jgi:hypothetical protein